MTKDLLHGGALDVVRAAFPDAPEPWIDLSTGINPWPYPDSHVSPEVLAHLPTQADQAACRAAMAAAIGASPHSILLAPGSELLIRLLPDCLPARRVAILSPTYGDHADAWARSGTDIVRSEHPLEAAAEVDAVVVTHPNNPDGRRFDLEALEQARRTLTARGGYLIIDEAYADLHPEQSLASHAGADGLIILRSFGKFFGLAGVRLGATLAPANVRERLAARLGVWPVSGAALEIGTRAYADTAWQTETRHRLAAAAARLDAVFSRAGLPPCGGTDLFRYIEVADAHEAFAHFARLGIYVRRFEWSKRHLRIGLPATQVAETRLAEALNLLNGWASPRRQTQPADTPPRRLD
ncbi:MAG: threonine-phosphate decarboxylase CobD [Pseudomonadota bacterium]